MTGTKPAGWIGGVRGLLGGSVFRAGIEVRAAARGGLDDDDHQRMGTNAWAPTHGRRNASMYRLLGPPSMDSIIRFRRGRARCRSDTRDVRQRRAATGNQMFVWLTLDKLRVDALQFSCSFFRDRSRLR